LAITFAECLERMLDEKNAGLRERNARWSASRLALALDVDPSLVRRWLRGERVPALKSTYVDTIASALELGPQQRADLKQAQLGSLQAQSTTKPAPAGGQAHSRSRSRQATRTLESTTSPQKPRPQTPLQDELVAASPEEMVPFAEAVLGQLPHARPAHALTILVAQHGQELASLSTAAAERWTMLFGSLLTRGWDIECLLRLPDEPAGLLPLVRGILALCSTAGTLRLRYFSEAAAPPVPYNLLVVPQRFALLGLATRQDGIVDSVLRLVGPGSVAAAREHVLQLRRHTAQLFTRLPEEQFSFDEEVAVADRQDSRSIYLVKDGLSIVTLPPRWARPDSTWVRSRASRGLDARIVAANIRQRLEQVHEFTAEHSFRIICPISAIDRWLTTGSGGRDPVPIRGFPVSPDERLERIEHLAFMLDEYAHFEVGLWDAADGALTSTYFQVYADQAVLLSNRRDQSRHDAPQVHLKITHPALVAAFALEFEQLWTRIPPVRRSKTAVAEWLRARADSYRGSTIAGEWATHGNGS
jgi:hypothetical protein